MTTNTARTLLLTTVIGLGLALGACGQGGKDDKTAAKDGKDAKKDAKGKAGDAKTDAKKGDVKADEAEPELAFDDRVVKAANLAKKIEADPSKADDILAEAGLDRPGLEALMFEISTPELADQYRLARARAQG
jgi:hypothetical protein